MGIDIRLPIGILFSLLGVILTAYGFLVDTSRYGQSSGININFDWGLVLLVFGILMFLLGRKGARTAPQQAGSDSSRSSGHR
jgi:hypothetical protein